MSLWVLQLVVDPKLTENNYIWMPVGGLPDLSQVRGEGELKKKLRELHGEDATPESLRELSDEYLRFLRQLGKEEVIAVPQGESIAFAEITGPVYFEGGAEFPHRIAVEWLGVVPLSKFRKHKEIFAPRKTWLREVNNRESKTYVMDRVPGKQSKFAKWKWILIILITIRMIHFAISFAHREFTGI